MFFDPLGILQPFFLSLKLLFQILCKEKFERDESIWGEFKSKWNNILSYLGNVRTIEIPRKVLNHMMKETLHKGLNFMDLVTPASKAMVHVFIWNRYLKSVRFSFI